MCEKGTLTVIFSLKKIQVYLLWLYLLEWLIDHDALQYIFKEKDVHESLERWMDFLGEWEDKTAYKTRARNYTVVLLLQYAEQEDVLDKAENGGNAILTGDEGPEYLEPFLIAVWKETWVPYYQVKTCQ